MVFFRKRNVDWGKMILFQKIVCYNKSNESCYYELSIVFSVFYTC